MLRRKKPLRSNKPLKPKKALKQNKPLKATRKVSGQKALFIQLWALCQGRSQLSGLPLLPPEHPMFHYQGSHLLPKGNYPERKLDPENIVMITPEEHILWGETGVKEDLVSIDPRWGPIVAKYRRLQLKTRIRDGKRGTGGTAT